MHGRPPVFKGVAFCEVLVLSPTGGCSACGRLALRASGQVTWLPGGPRARVVLLCGPGGLRRALGQWPRWLCWAAVPCEGASRETVGDPLAGEEVRVGRVSWGGVGGVPTLPPLNWRVQRPRFVGSVTRKGTHVHWTARCVHADVKQNLSRTEKRIVELDAEIAEVTALQEAQARCQR